MEVDLKLSAEAISFIRHAINKIYEGRMVYCSTAKSGIEVWHEGECRYTERGDPFYCAAFLDSAVHKKQMNKNCPNFEKQWLQKNYAMAVFKVNDAHFVYSTDNKQYNFEIPKYLQEELVTHAKLTGRYAEFKPILAIVNNAPKLKSV